MKINLSSIDRVIRMIVAITLAVLFFTKTVTGGIAYVALAGAIVLAGTSLIRFCPLYFAFGISSIRKKLTNK